MAHPIAVYSAAMNVDEVSELCSNAYDKTVATVDANHPGKFLAVLFKNPNMSKSVFDSATACFDKTWKPVDIQKMLRNIASS